MASRAKISTDPAVLLEYSMKVLSCDSESDNDFDGYVGPEDGPVACATVPEVVEREGLCSLVWRSLSTDDLTAAEVSELPESPFTSSVSPCKANILAGPRYRFQVKLTQATLLFLTLQLYQLLRYAKIHYDIATCFEYNHAKVLLSSREQRKLVTWYKRFQGCIAKGMLTKKTSSPPRKRHRSKMTNGHPCG